MSLSIKKLCKLLDSSGFYPSKFFNKDRKCLFINIISKRIGQEYILYIPSKYTITTDRDMKDNVYDISTIDNIKINKDIVVEYGYDHETKNMEHFYRDKPKNTNETDLLSNYKETVSLNDEKSTSNDEIKALFRQINRIKYSVGKVDYKVVVEFKCYMIVVNRVNDIVVYHIKRYNNTQHKLLVCLDLETLYKDSQNFHGNLSKVKNSVSGMLSKNISIN